jgi:hypothetical protein
MTLRMPIHRLLVLAALTHAELVRLGRLLPAPARRRGRPCICPPLRRVVVACAALRVNLTVRELAAVVGLSKSTVHRILATLAPMLANLARPPSHLDRRETWIVDGYPDPHPRPCPRREVQELPLVLQRPDPRPLARPSRDRNLGRRTRQPQRSGPLPRLDCRGALHPTSSRPRRRWIPRCPRPSRSRLRPESHRSRSCLASASPAPRSRRAHHRPPQELADPPRSPSARRHVGEPVAAVTFLHNLKLELRDSS